MVAIKGPQAEKFIAAPPAAMPAVLIYGPDEGLALERSQRLAAALAAREKPASEILKLSDLDLETDPDRLAVELQTVAMFSGRKVVRATAGRRITAATLAPLVEAPALEGYLIVEAGNLKPDDALRKLFEKSAKGAAIACYADDAADLSLLLDETLRTAGMGIDMDARQALLDRLGADRALSRGEIDKLVLYCDGRRTITLTDVADVVGDAGEVTLDRVPEAAANGNTAAAIAELTRVLAAGETAQTIILAVQRYFVKLHRLRAAVDAGRSIDDALRELRPPPFFKQRDVLMRHVRAWPAPELAAAVTRCAETAKAARLNGALEDAMAERLVLSLVQIIARNKANAVPLSHRR